MNKPKLLIRPVTWISVLLFLALLTGCAAPAANSGGSTGLATQAVVPTSAAATAPVSQATTSPALEQGSEKTATSAPTASSGIPNSGANGDVQYTIVPEQSEARYRIREQLVNVSLPNDAIGKTRQVSGTIAVKADGTVDKQASKITVNVDSLQSDRSQRDNYVRRNILQTSQYPEVVFVPNQMSGLPSPLPQSGEVRFQVTGDLTIKNVTKPVTWDVTGKIDGDTASGLAQTTFTFADFQLDQPRVPVVLSVEDKIVLEMDVTLKRTGGQAMQGAAQPTTAAQGSIETVQVPVTASCTSPAALTPAMTEGPYFKAGSPEQSNLLQPGMNGTKLTLTGYVLTTDCQPVSHALIEFWQADAQGQYDNSGYTLRGYQFTDDSGKYQLVTVIPGLYPGRTEHIHVKVQAPNSAVLTTQLFFPDVAQNASDQIYDQSLLIQMQDSPDGKLGMYNFIIQK